MKKQIETDNHPLDLDAGATVVIPVYNSEGSIEELTARLHIVLPQLFPDYEIILINDGSHDNSWKVIQKLCQHPRVRGFNLMRNFGQHNALLCGIRSARFETIITMDDDLQHPPEQLPLLVETYNKGYDVVYAVPKKLPHSWWRNLGSKLTKFTLSKFMRIPIQEIGAFRIFRTELRNAFADYHSPDVYIDPLLSWGTTNFGHVFVEEEQRKVGTSNYTFRKLVHAGLLILTGYSTIPLRLASTLGFVFMIVGFLILIYALIIKLAFDSVAGFPFLASIIALFSGVQLFTLGIIGEYLARMYDRSTDRPPYIVKSEVTGRNDDLES
ncbi:MAG: glycosyltransferase family 2 protein [Flexilinea flocculi]|mgnify:CR=1 FL=1|jgi:glycosyltransferase involved in cell wall biosynthesis|nr:glycosyltransferase family 2 protein [Flexilinea flocculi]